MHTSASDLLLAHFDAIADAPGGVARLRQLILQLAVQGRLVEQDPGDEPARVLLERIRAEKASLSTEYKAKKVDVPESSDDEVQPFAVPHGWVWTDFESISSYIQRGKSPRYALESAFPVIAQKCIQWDGLHLNRAKFIELASAKSYEKNRLLRAGDLLWNSTGTGTLGRVVVYRPEVNPYGWAVADSHVTVIRPIIVDPQYLFTWIASPAVQTEIEAKASGTTNQIELATSTVRNYPVPLPPLAEQRRIVARVDALMALCDGLEERQARRGEERRRLLAALVDALLGARDAGEAAAAWERLGESFDLLLEAPEDVAPLRQAVLQLAVQGRLVEQDPEDEPARVLLERIRAEKARLVRVGKLKKVEPSPAISAEEQPFEVPTGWEWCRLKELGVFYGGGTPSKAHPEYWGGEIPWVSPKDMKKLYIDDAQDHISQVALANTVVQLIPSGSLLFVVRGMILAHSFPVALTRVPVTINQDMKALQPHLQDLQAYLLLVCRAIRDRVLAMVERSTHGTCRLDSEQLENLTIPMPPLAEQRRIVARVEQLMALCDALEAQLREERAAAERLAEALCAAVMGAPSMDAGELRRGSAV